MWTLRKISVAIGDREGASRAAGYVLEAADSPHAFGSGGGEPRAMAYWLGSENALGKLGLTPGQHVDKEDLMLALQGRHTDGSQVRKPGWTHQRARDGQGRIKRDPEGRPVIEKRLGVASYDMTFSAPKSVSVLWSQASPELRARIERAMFEAWNVATEHLIRSHDVVMQGRSGGERPYGPASGFAAAVSLHVTARRAEGEAAPAPQLHVHGELVGLERLDGILAAINSKAIYGDPAFEAGAYARAHLAESLVAMGFEIEWGTGNDGLYFEVKGIAKELLADLSGRSKEIEAAAGRRGAEREEEISNRERAALAAITRLAKEGDLASAEIEEWWRERCERQGFSRQTIAALIGRPEYAEAPEEAREGIAAAVEAAIRSRGPAVTRAAARGIVVATSSGRLSLAEAENVIDELQAQGALLPLEEGWVTTPYIRDKELAVMGVVERANGRARRALSPEAIAAGERVANAGLGEHTLDKEQRQAIAELGQGAGWSLLTGRAGTGKTPVLQALAEAHRQDGWKVVACAIDWETAHKLGKDVGAEPLSISQVVERARRGDLVLDRDTLILIDEAGKIGLEAWSDLAELVDETEARVIGVGHAGQLGAVELPGMFEEMTLRRGVVEVSELREVRRHKHEWMRELQEAIDDGRGKEAVAILERNQAITFCPTKDEMHAGMVDRWVESRRRWGEEEAVMILQGTNKDLNQLNLLAQERLLQMGHLKGPGVEAPGLPYKFHAGDLVVLRDAAWTFPRDERGRVAPPLTNGTQGIVRRVDPRRKLIEVELKEPGQGKAEPRRVTIDLGRAPRKQKGQAKPPSWRLSYGRLPFPSQGLSIPAVVHGGGDWSQGQESSYVGLSRQEQELHDFVNCEGFHGSTPQEWREEYARLLSLTRRRQASIHYEEDPGRQVSSRDRAAGRTLPERMASELEAEPGWRERPLAAELDPLAPHRGVLGERRSAWIERRSRRYGEAVGRMHGEMLRAELASAREAFALLDRQGALKTLGIERDREALEERRRKDLEHATSLEHEAAALKGRKAKAEREALLETAQTQRRLAAEGATEASRLRAEERELREEGSHLDGWMREEGDSAARFVALERELFGRRERGLEEEIAEVLHDPPADVVELAGPAPEHGSPEREEWEGVVWEHERNRLVAEGRLPGAAPSARQLRDLNLRAERLRQHPGSGFETERLPGSSGLDG